LRSTIRHPLFADSLNCFEASNHGNRSIALPDAVEKAVLAAA
jgi:hypothetical protein